MQYSYNWLKELSETNKTVGQMADLIMMHSFEVESIEEKGKGLENVVVGKILEIKKHPNADKLQLTKIDIGNKKLDIVCGAWNIKVDDKVPVALVGAKLQNGIVIKEAEIRGIKSFGMLCAEDELGLGKSHEGILILGKDAEIGEKLTKALDLDDAILEIKVLPDRSHDALCHIGIAREISALDGKKIDYYKKIKLNRKKTDKLSIKIQDQYLCPRYIGAVMTDIKIEESPTWMKSRLNSLGINPINNIVDATNYVMLELGQPLHAFDFDQIKDDERVNIFVRRAIENEKITLLDGSVKELFDEDLLITNKDRALAVAGVMGGENSGINENTTKIVIESANFNSTSIRKTRMRLKVKTEASDRFEKEIDPNVAEIAMARIIEIVESYGGKIEGVVDVYSKPVEKWKIKLDLAYVGKLLGEEIPEKTIINILESLQLKTKKKGRMLEIEIPTFRIDLKTQEDIIEEIGRIYGYEKINSTVPFYPVQPAKMDEERQFEKTIRDYLVGAGFSEVYNYSFYGKNDAEMAGLSQKHLELENPINPEQALMRVSLVPGILNNIKENLKNFKEIEIFEIGRIYIPKDGSLPEEKNMLVGAIVSDESKKGNNFYEAKGYVDLIFNKLGIEDHYFDEFKNSEEKIPLIWHKTRFAEIEIEGSEELIGYVGEMSPIVLERFRIKKRVAIFEIDMEILRKVSEGEREFKPLRKFPTSMRDISMTAEPEVRVEDILDIIQGSGMKLIIDVDLFDIFDLPEEKTSFAFHIIFGADDRTLKNQEVDEIMKKITENLEKDLKVEIRK